MDNLNKDDKLKINNRSHNPDEREWEYDGCGNRVYKGTNILFKFEDHKEKGE